MPRSYPPQGSSTEHPPGAASLPEREHLASIATVLLPSISFDQLPTMPMPVLRVDQMPTQRLKAVRLQPLDAAPAARDSLADDEDLIDQMVTLILPVVKTRTLREATTQVHEAVTRRAGGYLALARNLAKSSGIFALASLAGPLVSLVLSPFLARTLSQTDYGILTILTTVIGLGAGVSQLGLGSAFFRAYNFDYTSPGGRRAVVATVLGLLSLASLLLALAATLAAPALARWLLGRSALAGLIVLAVLVVLLQNLTVPVLAWLRAENRPVWFSLLSLANLLINLLVTIVLVGLLRTGIAGALIATGAGYAFVALCVLPVLIARSGLRLRLPIARRLLGFGLPLILSFTAYWVLQLSDRYLLSLLGSLAQTASYGVAYSLGTVLSTVIITPFGLAWPTTMYAIAKRKDAARVFQLVFRWFGMLLLFCAFAFSLVGTLLLDRLFPASYYAAAPVIPLVAEAIVFYGLYYLFLIGVNVRGKTWLTAVFMGVAAFVNFTLNLALIPAYGARGAALSTLIAFIVLAFMAYVANQLIYPIPFEIGRFLLALLGGVGLYLGAARLAHLWGALWTWPVNTLSLLAYGICLFVLVKGFGLPRRSAG
ncbi:MAG TPA: polysaccharide biosynthesis C-terminal domain-containing protein [Ktedonobacterales bacterium]|nr:polysaccharide biosynthesis C-terminal domain-containing protein [Ktedonobacterales bacterium]